MMSQAQQVLLPASGLQVADSLIIFYRAGYRYVDPAFRNNGQRLTHFLQSVRKAQAEDRLERIAIHTGASPDGDRQANNQLTEHRANELVAYILEHTTLSPQMIEKHAGGVNWEGLRRLVETANVPHRNEVLQVLDKHLDGRNETDGQEMDRCKKALIELRKGVPYKYMRQFLFPDLRSSSSVLLYVRPARPESVSTDTLPNVAKTTVDEQAMRNQTDTTNQAIPTGSLPAPPADLIPTKGYSRLRLKTNALGWGLLVMNVAVEWEFSERFSLHVPIFYSGANYFSARTKFRLLGTQPELRIYPLRSNRFFAGVHFGVASYNLALGRKNWRIQDHNGHTPTLGGGLSVGYRMPFCRNKRFLLEFSVGAGAYRAQYDKFRNEPNGAYDSTVRDTYIGIDNVAVSFSYSFDLKRRNQR